MNFTQINRRTAIRYGLASVVGFGSGALLGGRLFADRTQLAARIEETPAEHPLLPALQLVSEGLKALDSVKDYTAVFHKQELVGRRNVSSRMELKLREEPFSVYLKFVTPHSGREVIYVTGANNGNLLVHETGLAGLAGTVTLDPNGKYAMDENRYPLTLIGMRTLAATVIEQWLAETKINGGVSVNFYPNAKIGQTSCKAVETSYRAPAQGIKYQLTRMYVDAQTNLPIRVQQYGFPARPNMQAPLIEDYMYTDIKTNVGLGPVDFDTRNPKYGF